MQIRMDKGVSGFRMERGKVHRQKRSFLCNKVILSLAWEKGGKETATVKTRYCVKPSQGRTVIGENNTLRFFTHIKSTT